MAEPKPAPTVPAAYTGPERRAATRAEVIAAALRKEVIERAASLDRADDLGEVTVTIKLQAGTTWVRSVVWQEERFCRQRR